MYEYENVSVEWADNTVRFDYVDRADERVPLDIPEHWHEELEINYTITGGNREYVIDGETEQMAAGDFVVVNPFEVHGVHRASRDTKSLLLLISRQFIEKFGPRLGNIRFILKPSIFMSAEQQQAKAKLADLMLSVWQITKTNHEFRDDELIGVILQILSVMASHYGIENKHTVTENVADTIAYVQRMYASELSLELLADRVHLSTAYFDRCFKKQTGYSVMQYVNKVRSMHAYQLLTVHHKGATFTATAVGFPSTQALNRGLKNNFGLTATALKNS